MDYRRRLIINNDHYVKKDLIAYWDGIRNTGNDHDSSASKWVDIVNGYEMQFQNTIGSAWNADNLELSSGHRGLHTPSKYWQPYEYATIELVIIPASVRAEVLAMFDPNSTASTMPAATQAREIYLANTDSTIGVIALTSKTYDLPAAVNSLTDIKKIVVTYHDYAAVDVYVNNIKATIGSNNHSYGQFGPNNFRLGEWMNTSGSNSAPFYGKIYAVRYYGRVLTEDEITANYKYDIQRYVL